MEQRETDLNHTGAMMNALVSTPGTALVPQSMDDAIRLAKAMSSAKLMPRHLQDDIGSCLMVVEQAMRWGMSPFAVAQCTSKIGDKLMFEGKLIAAAVESCGAIEGHFDYEYAGQGDDRQVTVKARRRGETNDRQLTVRLRDVKTKNEWWDKQPDQQLAYSSTRQWARRYTPSAMLGVYAPEEIDKRTGATIDGEVVVETPTEQTSRSEENPDPSKRPVENQAPKMTWAQLLENLDMAVHSATTGADIEALLNGKTVKQAEAMATGETKRQLDKLLADARTRQAELDDKAEGEIPWEQPATEGAPA